MTASDHHEHERSSDEREPPTLDDGRYVYCVVLLDGESGDDTDDGADVDAAEFETTGVEGEPVSIVASDGIGAVVHECDEIYDSADLGRIRRWLVRHQTVVDDAAEAFGTPLPFQFDTIIRGDDEAVREWLERERDRLREILESLAGHWEYRIEVVRTDPVDDETLEAQDERLAELREQIDDSSEGAGFLLEKQYDRRATEVRSNRRAATAADLRERLDEHAREVHELERSPSTTLQDEGGDAGGEDEDEDEREHRETVCRLTLLAHEDQERAIGSVLDDVAAEPGIEIRFTGPWPPYTFAPELGGDDSGTGTGTDDRGPTSSSSSPAPSSSSREH